MINEKNMDGESYDEPFAPLVIWLLSLSSLLKLKPLSLPLSDFFGCFWHTLEVRLD